MSEHRYLDERYAKIAEDLLATEDLLAHVAASGVRIAYLCSDAKRKSKGRLVLGKCERVPARYQWAVPYDFTITVFEPNVAGLSESQLRILLTHELLHVGVEFAEDGVRYSIVGHDVEDFSSILELYGAGWARPRPNPEVAE